MPVAVVIHPGASAIPARFWARLNQTRSFGNVGEGALSVVVVEHVLAVVGDKEVVVAVVIVVAHATGLPPAGTMFEARALGYIGERAIAIVLEQPAMGLVALRKSLETPAVNKENVKPAVVVVVVKGEPAAGGLQQVFVLAHTPVSRFEVQSRTLHHIQEANS